jgi:hypothetical protein
LPVTSSCDAVQPRTGFFARDLGSESATAGKTRSAANTGKRRHFRHGGIASRIHQYDRIEYFLNSPAKPVSADRNANAAVGATRSADFAN